MGLLNALERWDSAVAAEDGPQLGSLGWSHFRAANRGSLVQPHRPLRSQCRRRHRQCGENRQKYHLCDPSADQPGITAVLTSQPWASPTGHPYGGSKLAPGYPNRPGHGRDRISEAGLWRSLTIATASVKSGTRRGMGLLNPQQGGIAPGARRRSNGVARCGQLGEVRER